MQYSFKNIKTLKTNSIYQGCRAGRVLVRLPTPVPKISRESGCRLRLPGKNIKISKNFKFPP